MGSHVVFHSLHLQWFYLSLPISFKMCDIIENEAIDKDTLPADEIDKIFNKPYNLLAETAVTLKKSYISKLSITK